MVGLLCAVPVDAVNLVDEATGAGLRLPQDELAYLPPIKHSDDGDRAPVGNVHVCSELMVHSRPAYLQNNNK